MITLADQNVKMKAKGDSSSYTEALEKMIEVNNRLEESLNGVMKSVSAVNEAYKSSVQSSKETSKTVNNIVKNINKSSSETIDTDFKQVETKAKQSASNVASYIKNLISKTSGELVNKVTGSKTAASITSKITESALKYISKSSSKGGTSSVSASAGALIPAAGASGSSGAAGAGAAGAAALGPILLVAAAVIAKLAITAGIIKKLNDLGSKGYDTTMSMTRAYKELGEAADYGLGYAVKLSEDLGQSLDVTLDKLARVSKEMRHLGMTSRQAGNVAVTSEGLSQNIAYAFGISDVDKVREQFLDALSGGSGLEFAGAFTGDSVMAAWLAQTKGINMYTSQISEAQMAAYRLEKIVSDLGNVSLSTGETLTNLNINLDSTWARNQQISNQLESTRKKWEALMIPVYKLGVAIKSFIVDKLYSATNAVLGLLGKEQLSLSEDVLVDQKALNSVYDLNAAYSQTGEAIKAAKGQLLAFDELISLTASDTLNPEEGLDFANNSKLTGLGFSLDEAIEKGVPQVKKLKGLINDMDIQLATSGYKLKSIWDSLDDTARSEKWVDFAIRFAELGEDIPDWLKDFGGGKYYETWVKINAALESGDKQALENLLEDLHDSGIYSFDAVIKAAIEAADKGYKGSLDDLLHDRALKRTIDLSIKVLLGAFIGSLIGRILLGEPGAVIGAAIGIGLNLDSAKEAISGLISELKRRIKNWWEGLFNYSPKGESFTSERGYKHKSGRYITSPSYGERNFASGGIALRPMTARLGEAGYPELVQPLGGPKSREFYDTISEAVKGSGALPSGNTSINVTIPVSNMFATNYELRQLSDIMADYLAEALRNRGALDSGVIM